MRASLLMPVSLLLGLIAGTSALRVDALGRRAALMGAGSALLTAVAPATSALTEEDKAARRLLAVVGPAMQDDRKAQLSQEDREAVLKRARTGGLRTDLVLERARQGALFDAKEDGKSASCWDLTNLKSVDEKALQAEIELLADLEKIVAESQTASLKQAMKTQAEKVALIDLRLQETIAILKVEVEKKCGYDEPLALKLYD